MEYKNKMGMIDALKSKYQNVDFDIHEEHGSLQLLHNSLYYENSDDFFNDVCDIAIKYLTEEEQMIFAILYDYYGKIPLISFGTPLKYNSTDGKYTSNYGAYYNFVKSRIAEINNTDKAVLAAWAIRTS